MPIRKFSAPLTRLFAILLLAVGAGPAYSQVDHIQGEMAGEVTSESVLLQSRLTASDVDAQGDVPGAAGVARFDVAENANFVGAVQTPWLTASPETDSVVKTKVTGLKAGTRYHYRLVFGLDAMHTQTGPTRSFKTLPAADQPAGVNFVVVTGMNYAFFHDGPGGNRKRAYQGEDKSLGYPALVAIGRLQPDFLVGTGDNVYYDHPVATAATTADAMRRKWHEQFVQPRFVELFSNVPAYWQKDDHDYRYNDCDNSGDRAPSSELGASIFREQVPVVDPTEADAVTYRTHRVGRLLQIWLTEGRDDRSPNRMPDGPDKSLWGRSQRAWLMQSLLASDAKFKIIISPTAMVGPDDRSKRDNHTNLNGFRYEGDTFFDWIKTNEFLTNGLYFVCGDRHWQYHSIHPSGFEEFSCGALVDANSRRGVRPGNERGTDPEGLIRQPYTSPKPSGGFLQVVVEPGDQAQPAALRFNFYDEHGELLYSTARTERRKP